MHRLISCATAILIVAASLLILSGHAYGHERRTVGPYQLEVGWELEPAYAGQLNYMHLEVVDVRTGKPVAGVEKTLTADVAAGGLAPFKLAISATGEVGLYKAPVIPTVTGAYTFHISGKIETLSVNEKFASGPNTFDDVADVGALQYPTRFPIADDLGRKLDAIQSGIDQARIIAIVALALAVVGLGAAALARRRT